MTLPGVPLIRVGHMVPRLPYPVNLHLPPTTGNDTRTNTRNVGSELDIVIPQCPERHEKLGHFLDAWGGLESTLAMLLAQLIPSDLGEALLIFPKLGIKNACDVLTGLGMRKLAPHSTLELTNL
jgi:hypothetical protein